MSVTDTPTLDSIVVQKCASMLGDNPTATLLMEQPWPPSMGANASPHVVKGVATVDLVAIAEGLGPTLKILPNHPSPSQRPARYEAKLMDKLVGTAPRIQQLRF